MANFAVSFNGSDGQSITAADSNAFDPGSFLTVECWIYCTNTSLNSIQTFFKKDNSYILRMDGAIPKFLVFASTLVQPQGGSISINTWTHVAGVYDGSNVNLYINGIRVAQTAASGSVAASANSVIVGNGSAGEGFPGRIDEMRISNSVRYTGASFTVPTASFVTDGNTMALWHFDEGTGTSAADSSSNSLALSTFVGSWVTGRFATRSVASSRTVASSRSTASGRVATSSRQSM